MLQILNLIILIPLLVFSIVGLLKFIAYCRLVISNTTILRLTFLRPFLINWAVRWVLTSLIVGGVFFWLKATDYTGALYLWIILPVFPFSIFSIWFGNTGVLVVYVIVYGGLVSTLLLPTSYTWVRRAKSSIRNYLLSMLALGTLMFCATIGGGV